MSFIIYVLPTKYIYSNDPRTGLKIIAQKTTERERKRERERENSTKNALSHRVICSSKPSSFDHKQRLLIMIINTIQMNQQNNNMLLHPIDDQRSAYLGMRLIEKSSRDFIQKILTVRCYLQYVEHTIKDVHFLLSLTNYTIYTLKSNPMISTQV